jgi:sugar phosphate isomerase/epimerase
MKRKEFLRASALATAGMVLAPGLVRADKAKKKVKNIGIQLYTVRGEMLADPKATLLQLAKIGFKNLESARSEKGNYCKKAGLHFGYHNHDSEFATVEGTVLYDVLLSHTDPSLVTMEMDLGWVVAAGHDPLNYFRQHPGRFPLWHLKDMDKTRKQSTEFGKGQVNIKGLLQHAEQAGMKHFFLEQEEYAHSAFESIRSDYEYLTKLDY